MANPLLYRTPLSLSTLEAVWKEKHSDLDLLTALQPTLTQILVQPDQHLFLDMVKFVAMLLTEVYEKLGCEVLEAFTERILVAVHLTVNKYYNKDTFDQNRYLDCVAAILSIWIDCTKKEDLIIPKIDVFIRQSQIHVLDVILQSLKINGELKCQLLDQITSLDNIDTYVKYTIASRGYDKFSLHAKHPSEDAFRCWLLKHNIVTVRSVSDFLENSKADEDLLSSMCRPFYTLPPTGTDTANQPETDEVDADALFFIDRGEMEIKSPSLSQLVEKVCEMESSDMNKEPEYHGAVVESEPTIESTDTREDTYSKEECMSVDTPTETSPTAPLVPPQGTVTSPTTSTPSGDHTEYPQESEPCIKIRNLRKGRSKPSTPHGDVIVVKLPTTPAPESGAALVEDTTENGTTVSETSNTLTEEALASLPDKPSVRKRGRPRKTSEESVASVDSVASRTRQRNKVEQTPLQAISEEAPDKVVHEVDHEVVHEVDHEVMISSTKKSAKTSIRKIRTPKVKATPKCGSSSVKQGGVTERIAEIANETPQIPVRKTRSRKLNV